MAEQDFANVESQPETGSPSSTNGYVSQGAGAKRKRSGPTISSRSVASLTSEQLEKKRKNDREVRYPVFTWRLITCNA